MVKRKKEKKKLAKKLKALKNETRSFITNKSYIYCIQI